MLRSEKQVIVDDVRAIFDRSTSAVFVDFRGMTVAEVSAMREKFRARGIRYRVVKNTLVRRALEGSPYAGKVGAGLKGMTGVAWSFEEPSAAARVLKEIRKDTEKLQIKAGLLDGQVLTAKQVEDQLATLPSKDEARAMLLATFMAPAQQLVMLLNTPAGNFVRLLRAKEQKG